MQSGISAQRDYLNNITYKDQANLWLDVVVSIRNID